MLAGLVPDPEVVTHLSVRGREGSPAAPPTQIEVRVSDPAHISRALDWLAGAIDHINEHHNAHQRQLAATYQASIASVDDWYGAARARGIARQDPTRN